MENMFSAGELAKLQNISKQTLLYYDKIGLFQPSYTDPENGYRFYSVEQLDYLDTILIMKKIGFPLNEIKKHMKNYTTKNSMFFFRNQLNVIEHKIQELSLIKNRLEHRCEQIEQIRGTEGAAPIVGMTDCTYILYHAVGKPYDVKEISIATKKCYAQALSDDLPVFFQCGVCVPLDRIQAGRYTEAQVAFLTTDKLPGVDNVKKLPRGLTASLYHFGNYYDISSSYEKLMAFCRQHHFKITSDSYEFCINDYITSRYEEEFITKIMFYVEQEE